MPEGEMNIATRRQKLLMDALRDRIERLKEVMRVPYGMEEVGAGEYKRRWTSMSKEQRLAEIDRLGWPKIEELLLGGPNA